MSTVENGVALTRVEHQGVVETRTSPTVDFVTRLDEHWRLAQMLVKSGIVPARTPEAAMAIMLKAHELGIPAMHAFANLHYFDGKLVESAQLMVGMATERCGITYEVEAWDDTRCRLLFSRPGWSKPLPSEFTIEDAKRAGLLGKDSWKKFPRAMLLARAQAQGVRAIAPDRFAGMYSVEEMRDQENPKSRISAVASALDSPDDPPAEEVTARTLLEDIMETASNFTARGADATGNQRDRIREIAGRITDVGGYLHATLLSIASNPELGKGQAGALVNKLKKLLESMQPAAAEEGDGLPY